jgi:hypothetical protein
MSKQADQEKQQAEFLTSSEGQQSLLTEQEASQQELIELNGEQLMEVAGGVTHDQVTTALKHVGMAAACCAVGGVFGTVAGAEGAHTFGGDPRHYAKVGAAAGAAAAVAGWAVIGTCLGCYTGSRQSQAPARATNV